MIETSVEKTPAQVAPALKHNGPAAAMILAAGVGILLMGLATILATSIPTVKNALNWYNPAGPLSGKTGVGIVGWLISWALLHFRWRLRDMCFPRVWWISFSLALLGAVMLFPPVFEAFARH